jgi:hypothetical protein
VTGLKKWAQTPKVYVFNTDTGKVVTVLRCVAFHSDIRFDAKWISFTRSEIASVFEEHDADHCEHIAEVPTAYRAKSSILVPELAGSTSPSPARANQKQP